MQASRTAEREEKQHSAAALCSLHQIHAAELATVPSTDAAAGEDDTTSLLEADPPQQLVPALQQMTALRRERDALAKQVRVTCTHGEVTGQKNKNCSVSGIIHGGWPPRAHRPVRKTPGSSGARRTSSVTTVRLVICRMCHVSML